MSSSSEEEQIVIVIDNGSGTMKAGFAGEESPNSVFRPLVAKDDSTQAANLVSGIDARTGIVNPEAVDAQTLNSCRCPISNGIVTDWSDMESVWQHIFCNELQVNPEQHSVLLTEPVLNPKANREAMIGEIFEKFNVPSAYIANQSVLATYASGRVIALAVDCGDGVVQSVPVYEGYAQQQAILRLDFAGSDLTALLSQLLLEAGYSFSTKSELELVRNIKETLCYVAADFSQEAAAAAAGDESKIEKNYTLPDGEIMKIGAARFRCPEALFQPQLLGVRSAPIQNAILHSIGQCDIDNRLNLLTNVIVSGGSSLFPGFANRLKRELAQRVPLDQSRVKVVDHSDRLYSTWIGGSILGSLSTFQSMLIDRADYEEYGPTIAHKKCF